jgi:membrane protease YdiL (CAAX protease family)
MKKQNNTELSITKIIILGLMPGIMISLLTIILSSPAFGTNLPVLLSLMLSIIFGLIPIELGILKFIAWKENKKMKDIILYRNKTPKKKLFLSIIIPFVIASGIFMILPPYELKLWGELFNFIPDWFWLNKLVLSEIPYLKLTFILVFICNGFLGPVVEEIYFRGYLLPRMQKFGKLAPLVNMLLFSIYHFHTPYQNITRMLAVTPMVYSVWLNKDIRIGMIVHCLLNTCGNIAMLSLLFV